MAKPNLSQIYNDFAGPGADGATSNSDYINLNDGTPQSTVANDAVNKARGLADNDYREGLQEIARYVQTLVDACQVSSY